METRNITSGVSVQDIGGTFTIIVETATVVVNIMPLVVIIRGRTYRTRSTTDDIILILSLLYILSALFPSPIAHISYFKHTWIGGELSCKLYQVLIHTSYLSILSTVAVLTVNQTLHVFHFLNMREYSYLPSAKCKVVCIILLNVLASFVISVMPIVGLGPVTFESEQCEFWLGQKLGGVNEYAFLMLFLCYGTCNILLIVTSIVISLCCKSLIKRKISCVNDIQGDIQWHVIGSRVLTGNNLVVAVSIPVLITWVPTMVLVLMRQIDATVSDVSILYAMLSTSVSGMVNPIIYGLCDVNFRRGYRRLFRVLCNIKQMTPITDPRVTRSRSGTETLAPDGTSRQPVRSSSSIGFLNSAFDCQLTLDQTARPTATNEAEQILTDESTLPSEGTNLLTVRNNKNESRVILEESSSVALSEDLDSYEELSSEGSSEEEEEEEEGEKETFI